MNHHPEHPTALNGRQKRFLRALGHHLEPVVFVGREGITPPVVTSTGKALTARELIKVKLGKNCPVTKQEAARLLSEHTRATLVQLIGRMVLLYRPNRDLSPAKRIHLPTSLNRKQS